MQLLERTRQLLSRSAKETKDLHGIAEASDGAVPIEWLKKFYNNKIPNPGVKYLQALHDHLKSRRKSS